MPSLSAFLPPHLLRSLAKRKRSPAPPHVERFPAALLVSDISGFTALTEKLQKKGREGAEEIANLVNVAFRPGIRAIERQGGSIVSFGGDAIFAVFPGASPVRRAVAAAERVRESIQREGKVTLELAQAIHCGEVSGMPSVYFRLPRAGHLCGGCDVFGG